MSSSNVSPSLVLYETTLPLNDNFSPEHFNNEVKPALMLSLVIPEPLV